MGLGPVGIIATAQNLAGFFYLFTDYGFNLTAVRRIAQANGDKNEIQSTVNSVVFLKLILLGFAFLIYLSLIFFIPNFQKNFMVYLCSFALVIGQAFLPLWFYQGMEKISKTLLPVVFFKVLTIITILLLIKHESDAVLINLLFGIGNVLTGLYLFYFIGKEYVISAKKINLAFLKLEFKAGFAVFSSNVGVVIYGNSPLIILSFFLTPASIGIYSVVDKVIQILKGLLALVHQVTYPRICSIIQLQQGNIRVLVKQIYSGVWVTVLSVCFFLFLFPVLVISYFIKIEADQLIAANLLRSFSFILFITSLNMPFYQILLAYRKDWVTVRILFAAAIVSVLLNLILVPALEIQGAVITLYFVESLVTLSIIYSLSYFKKNYESAKL